MNGWKRGIPPLAMVLCLLAGTPALAKSHIDLEALAGQIADSLKTRLTDSRYRTVAISRIRQDRPRLNVRELIDFTNIKIVRGRRLKVIDRSKLELILKEQKIQLSDFVSANKYQSLGRLMGVDLFIYGTLYTDALVLKGIDVQNSAIVWADFFPVTGSPGEARLLSALSERVVLSLGKDLQQLKKAGIRLVSFWDFETGKEYSPRSVMDYLSVAITQDGNLRVVDRENIRLITDEQKLNQAVFIDQQNAKRLGELYGVHAFIYGRIKKRKDGSFQAALQMMSIFKGVIEWADLIKIKPQGAQAALTAQTPRDMPTAPPGMVYIPPGEFMMGANDGPPAARPLRRISLLAYFIDVNEVTNAEYLKYARARKYRKPVSWRTGTFQAGTGDHPVVGVNWEDARRYCAYLGKRLPNEFEWEKAARGTAGHVYPWGSNTFSPGFTVTRESGRKASVSVQQATRDLSPFKVKFMSGNVREWVQDRANHQAKGRGGKRVVRGGSWATTYRAAAGYHRDSSDPSLAWPDLGFRCAQSAPK